MKAPLRIALSFMFALSATCSISYADSDDNHSTTNPDHILGGYLITGEVWELNVYCDYAPDKSEKLHGVLTVSDINQDAVPYGTVLKATLGDLVYYGNKGENANAVTGWYLSGWPETCSYLPK